MRNIWDRTVILYGNQKIQEDFRFLFKKLTMVQKDIWDKEKEELIVICEEEKDFFFEETAQKAGFELHRDYMYIKDFFLYYNPIFLERGNRKLAVWGTGETAYQLWETLENRGCASEIDIFIDQAGTKPTFKGKKVILPEEIKDRDDVYIVVATYLYQWEIYRELEACGFRQKKDYIHCKAAMEDYSKLLERVCFSERSYSFHCHRPFGYCDVIGDNLYFCCPDFLPVSAGSMKFQSFMDCWNSYVAKILRLSILNGTYAFCNKQYCDLFDFEQEEVIQPKSGYSDILPAMEYPQTLMVGIDYSCNLRCPSCRKEVCVATAEERKEIERQAEDLLEHVIPYVNRLWMAGSGEVFFSKVYRQMLGDERCKKRTSISILSNGTLLDEKNWKLLDKTFESIEIAISMDGIKDETIEKLRRGANAQKLKRNLEFLGKLRKEGKIHKLFLSCVLQADNVGELYELLEYCKEIGVDKVQFLKLKNNGMYTEEEKFKGVSVFEENDFLKKEYQHYFTEELRNHPIADWFNSSCALQVEKRPRLDDYDTF
ncbi:MAG: radical SAM protein [Lachnospiraceae bacterium]|nr:radical SAM protein [Lachnospiraceae bacterium]